MKKCPITLVLVIALALAHLLIENTDPWALSRAAILQGNLWTLWSHLLVHSSLTHLLWDSVGLLVVGFFVESMISTKLFVGLLATVATGSALTFLAIEPLHAVVGVSGLQQGLVGALGMLFIKNGPKNIGVTILLLMVLKITFEFLGFSSYLGGDGGNIAVSSHLGGFLSGVAFVYFFKINAPTQL